VEKVIANYVEEGKPFIEFLQTHLTGCAKEKHSLLFRELMRIIANVAHTEIRTLDKIIHFKADDQDSIFNKTALNWANENNDQTMVFELVKREYEVHQDKKKKGLKCLKTNLNNTALLPRITETYINSYEEKQYGKAIFNGLIQLVLLVFFFLDIYYDIKLAKSYYQYAGDTFNISDLWMCGDMQLNSSCYERTGSDYPVSYWSAVFNQTDLQVLSYEEMHHSFKMASWVTVILLVVTMLFYISSITLDSIAPYLKGVIKRDVELGKCIDPNPLFLKRLGGCCKTILVWFFWPVVHILRRVKYEASPKRSKYHKKVEKCDAIWSNIKFVEYGLESSIQLFLQLWLLHPFLQIIAAWDKTELVNRCVSGFGNFFTFELHTACYVEKVLVRIVLSVLSLSLGMSQMIKKPGQDIVSILPMFVSTVAQIIGRMYAFKSLVLMSSPLGRYKYVLFFLLHIILVLIIKILFEVQSHKDSLLSCHKLVDFMKTHTWQLIRFIVSGISSTIVMIHLHSSMSPKSVWHSFFLSHCLFHLLILLENLILVCFPYILDGVYFPTPDCFTHESKLIALGFVTGMWLLGVMMHILQYKFFHPWGAINGPQVY
jgi:hypothetical protein